MCVCVCVYVCLCSLWLTKIPPRGDFWSSKAVFGGHCFSTDWAKFVMVNGGNLTQVFGHKYLGEPSVGHLGRLLQGPNFQALRSRSIY